jgi:D-hexose-6-phosphate mutarotase
MIPESFRSKWPFEFNLLYTITLTPTTLQVDFKVDNPKNGQDFSFTSLLHTYFLVDISSTSLNGLKGVGFKDSLLNTTNLQDKELLEIDQEVDRVYLNSPPELLLSDSKGSIVIRKEGFKDVVVWNPWVEKSKGMTDFEDLEYKSMICVEVGSVGDAITLKSGESWTGSQTLSEI